MKRLWFRFLCRHYYRYVIFWYIKKFINKSDLVYKTKSFYRIGNNRYLFVVAIHKRYGSQKASIAIIKPYVEWNLSYSFKKVNTRLWRDIFDLHHPMNKDDKLKFWDWHNFN